MAWAVTSERERKFQRKIRKSGKHYMSDIYKIGLFVLAFQTGSSGQFLVFFYTLNDNSMC